MRVETVLIKERIRKKNVVIVVCLYMHIVCLLPTLLSVCRKNKPGFSLGSPMGACWICCGSFRPKLAEAIWSSCMWIPRSWVAPVWSSPSEPMNLINFHTLELSRLPPVHAWGPQGPKFMLARHGLISARPQLLVYDSAYGMRARWSLAL